MNEVIGYVDTRAAEVATDAIAADVAQVHQDMLDADADASAAAASAAAAAGTLANAVKKTGEANQSIAGNIEVSGTLKSSGTLYATGDASVGGNLGVGGSTNVGDLTATGNVTVPTVATGTFNTKAANGTKVKNELDNYTPMIRTTGNQTKAGTLTLNSSIVEDVTYINHMVAIPDIRDKTTLKTATVQRMVDNDNRPVCEQYIIKESNGTVEYRTTISFTDDGGVIRRGDLKFLVKPNGKIALGVRKSNGITEWIYEEA